MVEYTGRYAYLDSCGYEREQQVSERLEQFTSDSWRKLRRRDTGPRWLRSIAVDALAALEAERERVRQMSEATEALRSAHDFLEALAKVLMKSEKDGGDVNLSVTISNFLQEERLGDSTHPEQGES